MNTDKSTPSTDSLDASVVAAFLADGEKPGSMTLKEYAQLYNIPLDAEDYRHEFPEDAPFTHPPTDDE